MAVINLFDLNLQFIFSKHHEEIITILRETVCYNQGKYIEFAYLVAEKHKLLKNAVYKTNPVKSVIEKHYNDLTEYINTRLYSISSVNFGYIREYYRVGNRSKYPPRVCTKTVKDGRIVDLVRTETVYYPIEPDVDQNTGFKFVLDNGQYFLCNDIPKDAKDGSYINPRLDDQCVRHYKMPLIERITKDRIDHRWCNCWIRDPGTPPPRWECTCYKSTLIVPMTLINNDLDEEFKRQFFGKLPRDGRTIWGFLCFDYPTTHYFTVQNRRVSYVFADALSLYYISANIHTEMSQTYQRASEILKGGE